MPRRRETVTEPGDTVTAPTADTPTTPASTDDQRTVVVKRADGEEFTVTPEVARALVAQGGEIVSGYGSANTGDTKALEQRITELEQAVADRDELLTLVPADQAEALTQLADAGTKES